MSAHVHYGYKWERLRRRHLAVHPHCVLCKRKGEHVDHIEPVRLAPWRKLDPSNLQSLCHACHNRITVAYDRGLIAGACDEQGLPLDPSHPWMQADNAAAIQAANRGPQPALRLAARLKRTASKPRQRQ